MEKLSSAPFPPWTLSSPLNAAVWRIYHSIIPQKKPLPNEIFLELDAPFFVGVGFLRTLSRRGCFPEISKVYDACKRSRVEAEIDNVRFRIPRFLVCRDETCILRFVEAWSLFSNIYYIRLIFLIPRWRVSVFIKEFKRFLFNFYKISLSRCKSAPTKMWIRTSFRSETKEEIPASTLLPFSLPFPPLIPRRVNSDGKRIKLFSPLENREPAGSFPFCPAKKFDRRRLTLWLPRFIFNEIFFRHALIF